MIQVSLHDTVTPALMHAFGDAQELSTQVLHEVATAAAAKWRSLASQRLGSTAADYAGGVQEPEYLSGMRAQVVLLGRMANMVEQGWPGGDMRQWLCGPGARNRKPIYEKTEGDKSKRLVGWYNTVPFSWTFADKGAFGAQSVGSLFDERGGDSRAAGPSFVFDSRQDLQDFTKEIQAAAKGLAPTYTTPGFTATEWGGKLEEGFSPMLTGMVRQETTYERKTESRFTTFRRISTRKTEGWVHPGITARHLAREVGEYARSVGKRAFLAALRRKMREAS